MADTTTAFDHVRNRRSIMRQVSLHFNLSLAWMPMRYVSESKGEGLELRAVARVRLTPSSPPPSHTFRAWLVA